MKKQLIIAVSKLLIVIIILAFSIYWAFYDIQHIKGQEILKEVSSPLGTYTVTAYLNSGGATVDYSVLCSVKTNGQSKEKNIYWQYKCQEADISWVDEQTVQINGVKLNVIRDTYDYRHDSPAESISEEKSK